MTVRRIAVTCTNPNSTAAATIMAFTTDGTTPATNGLGTGVSGTSLALSPVPAGGTQYNGYLTFMQSATLKIVAGINGQADSAPQTYTITVPTQTVKASQFGSQCGPGSPQNCPQTGGTPPPDKTLTYPSSSAFPPTNGGLWRVHDSGVAWPLTEPAKGVFTWVTFDPYLDTLNAKGEKGMIQITMFPCWDSGATVNSFTGNSGRSRSSGRTYSPQDPRLTCKASLLAARA